MKLYVQEIDMCSHCPVFRANWRYSLYWCSLTEDSMGYCKKIFDTANIPDWCPLEDVEKEGDKG